MKLKHAPAKNTAEEVKKIAEIFNNPSHLRPRNELLMDWSEDIPEVQSSPVPRVPRAESSNSSPSVLNYSNNQPTIASSWDGAHHALLIFGTQETSATNAANITQLITRMIDYFKHNPADKKPPAGEFADVVKALWGLIATIYTSRWDLLPIEDKSIRKLVGEKIIPGYMKLRLLNDKTVEDSSSPSTSLPSNMAVPLPTTNPVATPPLSTSVVPQKVPKPSNMKKSYAQASKTNLSSKVKDILQVKEVFPSLSANEVGKILKVKNSSEGKMKPKLNMTTRGPSRKEVITLMTKSNAELIMKSAHKHIANINECLKNSNSDIIADFIRLSNNGIIITMNCPANITELSRIKNFLKKIDDIDPVSIEVSCLPKFKSYMKIVGLPYNSELGVVTPNFIEGILKETHLFKDIILASKPRVIKASPKSNKAVVWMDIWDSQSGSAAKNIINHLFNIGCFVATIRGTNTNPGIPQCKNCWKWSHLTLSCHSHIFRCTKYYGAHITKHHREKV